jgi:type IV pilus assembly protein PilE
MVTHRYNNKGITLLELLVVIVIVGILAAVAIPIYSGYIQRARRSDAKVALEQVRAAQEMWRAERGSYAIDSGATAEVTLQSTMGVPSTTINIYYTWSLTTKTATAFTARATPTGTQAADGWLSIDQDGTKTDQAGAAAVPPYNYPDPRSKWSK